MNPFAPSPSIAPRTAPLVLIAAILCLLLAAAPAAGAQVAKKCRAGQVAWQVNGKTVCLKTAKLPTSPPRPTLESRAAAWFSAATAPKSPVRRPGRGIKLSAKLRRAIPRIAKLTAAAIKPQANAFRAKRAAGVATVVDRQAIDGVTKTLPGGVEVELSGELRRDENGNTTGDVVVDTKVDGQTVRFKTEIDDTSNKLMPEVGCPTADGKLSVSHTSSEGGTVMVLRGRRVVKSRTVRLRTTFRAEGQVGRDARLQSVKATTTSVFGLYERGIQLETTTVGHTTAEREGAIVLAGTPSVKARVRVVGASAAQERAAERDLAAKTALSPGTAKSSSIGADLGRWRMLTDEYKWYQLPNYCARAELTPAIGTLGEGDSLQVSATVQAVETGGEGAGSFAQPEVSRGAFALAKAEVDPGSPARFIATGGKPGSDRVTVASSTVVSSTAGRAIAEWEAESPEVNVPESFGGWIESETVGGGARFRFDAMFDFVRTTINYGPNGFVNVWYELDHIDAMNESLNAYGPTDGCRIEAKSSAGWQINSGDVELRRAGHGAPWTFALHVDFSIPNQLFGPIDCPPGAEPPSYTADIVNYLYSSPAGTDFRPIWSGSTPTDMRIIDQNVGGVSGPGMFPTTASWGLIGSY